ncbi:zinc ribbon domain-containing protein [Rhodococcus sp. NPDC003322]
MRSRGWVSTSEGTLDARTPITLVDRGSSATRQFSFTTRAHHAVEFSSGEAIGLDDIDTRVRWLLDLITAAGSELLTRLWHPAAFDALEAGRDCQGRKLPMQGHVAAARLGWVPVYPDGVYVPSRVARVTTAQVVSMLRTLAFRDSAVAALSPRFDPHAGRLTGPDQPDDRVPLSAAFIRNVVRQLAAHHRRTGGGDRSGPTAGQRLRVTDIQTPPRLPALARLSASDKQFAHLAVSGCEMVLAVKLPTCPAPQSRTQWQWVLLTAAIPLHLRGRAITAWHLPTLTMDHRGLLWRGAATEAVPVDNLRGATIAVGVDWSPSTLGAIATVSETPDGLSSTYRGHTYDDRGLGIKLARLQVEGQILHRKAVRLSRLATSAHPEVRSKLEAKIAILDRHRTAIGTKRAKINRELTFHFARQVTDHATAVGATVIGVEDLTTLEARGHGRVNNNRTAQSPRRKAVAALAHTATGVGVTVTTVPARGSSALCPSCNEPLTRPGGYHTAWCERCTLGGNRDHVAAVNIAKRALLGRAKTTRRRGQPPAVKDAAHAPVRKCRDKTQATPPQPRHRRVRHSTQAPPTRAEVKPGNEIPAPRASVWDTVKPVPPQNDTSSRGTREPHAPSPICRGRCETDVDASSFMPRPPERRGRP